MNGRRDSWDAHIIEGNKLFEYMIHNFETFFNGETIKHFEIRDEGIYDLGSDEIIEKYGGDIQKELNWWIHKEYNENRLFNATNWKPFRDKYSLVDIYMGYNYMFQFKKYYFQIAIEKECALDNCEYCQHDGNEIHFQLIICGWKEKEDNTFLTPYRNFPILPNNIIPEIHWQRK